MATLTTGQINGLRAAFMRATSNVDYGNTVNATKQELFDFLQDLDGYADTNAAAINNSIAQPMRGNLTADQKTVGFIGVLVARYLRDSPDELILLRQLINEAIAALEA